MPAVPYPSLTHMISYVCAHTSDVRLQVRKQQDVEDEEAKERGRVETLLNIRGKAVDMGPELWKITQEAG